MSITHTLPEFSADGRRLLSGGAPTKAGYRELTVGEIMARGADEATARRLASYRLTTSRRGTVGLADGAAARALTAAECRLLGRLPGPGND